MRIRFTCMLVPVALLLALMACAPSGAAPTPAPSAPTSAPTTAPALSGKIRFAYWEDPSTAEYYKTLVENFQKNNPNVQVERVTAPTGDYMNKLAVMTGGGDPADVFLGGFGFPYTYQAVQAGQFADLTARYTAELKGQLLESTVPPWTVEGKVVGIPIVVETQGLVCYNKNAFDQAGVSYPTSTWTPEDYRAAAKQLVQRDAAGKVIRWGALPGADFFFNGTTILLRSNGGVVLSPDGKKWIAGVEPNLKTNVEALAPYVAMAVQDKSVPTPAQVRELGFGEGMFERGEVAMRHCAFFHLPLFNKITAFDWGVALPDRWQEHLAIGISPLALSVSAASKNQDAAWAFVKYAASPEAQALQFKLSGQLPTNLQVLNSDEIGRDPMFQHMDLKAWIQAAKTQGATNPSPADTPVGLFAMSEVWDGVMDKAWKGELSVEQALQQMQPAMEKVFAKEAGQ